MDASWSRAGDSVETMAQMNSSSLDDLGNLFEFGDIDLNNIASVDAAQYDEHMQQTGTHPHTPYDEISEAQAISGTNAQDFGAHQQFGLPQGADHAQQNRFNGQGQTSNPYPTDQVFQQQMQSGFHMNQQFSFAGMHGFPPNQHVPPTPNSFEMHGEAGHFLQQQLDPQQRAILERRFQLRKEDAIAFTPMVSPAGTPQYSVPSEFITIPGAYFSPLTSPMLEAQNSQHDQRIHQQGYYTNPSTAPSSNVTSPLNHNIDVDMLGDDILLTEPAETQSRKSTRRKVATPRSAGPLARVKQSPIQKAIKRKSGTMLSSLAPTMEAEGMLGLQRSKSAQPTSAGLQMPRNDSSENESVSPEPLSEALMGPPPRPSSSKTQSPAITAQQMNGTTSGPGKAATPKSFLSMRGAQPKTSGKPDSKSTHASDDQVDFEDLRLPAAAADESTHRLALTQINTQLPSTSSEDTPRLGGSRKTPKLGPQSTPASARSSSAAPSPSLLGSPMTASTPGALLKDRRPDSKGGRTSKKRGSMSGNVLVSPALRPRISPSIKPLLPDGTSLHSPTHALLLASKSNYQNLLEGNHLPGVNYPDSLSTGLTSKRTSHKVAEQGRRNRINEALKEMQALLPKPAGATGKDASNSDCSPEAAAEGDGKESKEESAAKSNSSKAATVESANEYIRKLQKENAALLALKKENEDMKRKLRRHESAISDTSSPAGGGGSGSAISSPADAK